MSRLYQPLGRLACTGVLALLLACPGRSPIDANVVATYPTSQYVDNALYYQARVYVDRADCVSARAAVLELQTRFPASPELPLVQAYLGGGGC